ncbi:MAG: DUF5103 domain-containing protein [Bacteroidetes bacterium]|nr:DUF5103 domain-containing protein [Bacteroidota bacterium]
MKKFVFGIAFLSLNIAAQAQKDTSKNDEYVSSNALRYDDWTYVPNIKSILFYQSAFVLSNPVIELNSGQQLTFTFDDLEADNKTYYYTLIHCDAYWKPSDLMPQEYLSPFFQEQLFGATFSAGTTQRYTHYTWSFPTGNMQVTKSGNYILLVYLDNNKEKPAFTRRFMVYTNKVSIKTNIHRGTGSIDSVDFTNRQEVDFSVFYPGYNIPQLGDLKVVVQQNNRWDNAIYNMQPLYLRPNELSYDYDDGTNLFEGGNEYRAAVFKNFKFVTSNTDKITRDSANNWHVYLQPDPPRTDARYFQTTDIDGRFLITVEERDSSLIDISAEYAYVHFSFPFDFPQVDGNFYILGNMLSNQFSKENRMTFNYFKKRYECTLYLKQGYYDYMYVFLPDGKPAALCEPIEGTHWETENEYTIYVYHKQPGTYYDQLICLQRFSSVRK